jgi:hypothetical protein
MRGPGIVVLALVFVVPVRGQQQYTIRFKTGGKGHESTTEMNTRVRINVVKWDHNGRQVMDDLRVMVTKMAYATVILEEHGAVASRVKRRCLRAVTSVDGGPEEADELQGTTLILDTKEDGSMAAVSETGNPVPESLLKRLQSRPMSPTLTRFEDILPRKPVQVGESWPINAANWVKRDDVDLEATTAAAQLQRVYQKEGRLYGVIETRADFNLKAMRIPGQTLKLAAGSKLSVRSVRDGCIDGTATECSERGSYLFNAILQSPDPEGLQTKMDQEIDLKLNYVAK